MKTKVIAISISAAFFIALYLFLFGFEKTYSKLAELLFKNISSILILAILGIVYIISKKE